MGRAGTNGLLARQQLAVEVTELRRVVMKLRWVAGPPWVFLVV